MNWKKAKLGSVLQQYRVTHLVQDATVYKQVTISKHDGVCYRGTKIGKEIGRKRQFIIDLKKYPNTFMFVRQGVSDGALGIAPPEVDNCIATENMPMFAVKGIEVDYLNLLLKSIDFKRQLDQIPTLGSAQKAIHERQLLEIEIPLPSADEQREIVKAFEEHRTNVLNIFVETDQQLTHLTQLRQALLREAMQGQLLPQDPTDEPAAVLLQKLQAATAKLGKAGKRKQKELFAEEGPFEIPESWVWCTLGEVTSIFSGITLGKKYTTDLVEVPYLRVANVQRGFISTTVIKTLKTTPEQAVKYRLSGGDILVNEGGDFDKVGRCAIWNGSIENCIHQNHLFRVVADDISNKWVEYSINSDSSRSHFLGAYVKMTNLASISKTTLTSLPIPLPPLAEQHRIVTKLEQLLGHCDALEQRIRESRRLAEQLLQTALREALAPPAGIVPAEEAESELAEVEVTLTAPRRGRPLKKHLATNGPDLFSDF